MLRQLILASCVGGLAAGLVLTGLQAVGVSPLIFEAETYEIGASPELAPHTHGELTHVHGFGAAAHDHRDGAVINAAGDFLVLDEAPVVMHRHPHGAASDHSGAASAHNGAAADHRHDAAAWAPADGFERTAWTAVTNVGLAVGFALMLGALFAVRDRADWRQGLLWGAAGFVVFFANPAIGLHPVLPGAATAGLLDRQLWWLLAVACSASGVGLALLARRPALRLAGVTLLVVPHLVGAPHSEVPGSIAPPALVEQFVAATTVVNAVFWLVLGVVTALAYARLARR